jgi:predicted CxxxxCH...CXXCH cytochrome family protein
MRIIKFYFLLLPLAFLAVTSCSDTKDNLFSPDSISIHGTDVMNLSSSTFHGKILTSQGLDQCRTCHAADFSGGTAKVSCAANSCHPAITVHKTGILDNTSADFHETYIKNKVWNLALCSQCHGTDYNGGYVSPTCKTCHTSPGGPEACNTCHGDFSNPAKIAPARAINGATATTAHQVGAHSTHLYNAVNGKVTACNECHNVPAKLTSAGHIDNDGKAEVVFLTNKTGMASTTGTYNFSTYKCSNTYCHGNFELTKASSQYQFIYSADKMTGLNKEVLWTQTDGTQTACGTCHGLPPTGHVAYAINTCTICHQGVIDAKGKITDVSKHMNGKVNVFGTEY